MTFFVNQNGTVYEKNLGPKTEEAVKVMTRYNPDRTWRRAQ
jgi:sensor domain CHASE-containing protein